MNVLLFGDSKNPALRHEVPLPLPDPIAYLETAGGRTIVAGSLDVPRMRELGGYAVIAFEELGLNNLLAEGKPLSEAIAGCIVHACVRLGVTEVTTAADCPLGLADSLRAAGVSVAADGAALDLRRRAKTPAELAGIRRAMLAAESAMARVRERLAQHAELTSEGLRSEAWHVFLDHAAVPHDMLVIAAGASGADPHCEGEGPLPAGVPIVVDIFPRDMASGCWGDITRTFCIGDPPGELVEWHRVVREAQLRAIDAVRAGVSGEVPYAAACDVIEAAGYATRRTAPSDQVLTEGFVHYLGHGLGLDLHEAPTLDDGGEVLVSGDIITIEPGLYRPGFGGCRIEDVVLVTEDGCELITDFPYELQV